MENISRYSEIADRIRSAEMILIGIGNEFRTKLPEMKFADVMIPYVESEYYNSLADSDAVICAYKELRKLVGAKPYFAVTLNTDDLIYRGGFEKDLVVAPCGSMEKMQCKEHIVEAEPVRKKVLEEIRRLSAEQQGDEKSAVQILKKYAVCPFCGSPLQFHIKSGEGYLESGYLEQWQKYNRWLSCTLNWKLCVLELGVGFEYPQVIRWPFEKITYFNQKSELIRVHSRLSQTAAELGERGISVDCPPIDFCLSI